MFDNSFSPKSEIKNLTDQKIQKIVVKIVLFFMMSLEPFQ